MICYGKFWTQYYSDSLCWCLVLVYYLNIFSSNIERFSCFPSLFSISIPHLFSFPLNMSETVLSTLGMKIPPQPPGLQGAIFRFSYYYNFLEAVLTYSVAFCRVKWLEGQQEETGQEKWLIKFSLVGVRQGQRHRKPFQKCLASLSA